MQFLSLTLSLALVISSSPAAFAQTDSVPAKAVMVDGKADIDACSGIGQTVRLKRGGDNFLSVRAAPDVRAAQLDKLGQRHGFICVTRPDVRLGTASFTTKAVSWTAALLRPSLTANPIADPVLLAGVPLRL